MRYITLIAQGDKFDWKPGLVIKGANTGYDGFSADRDGILIAHDLLEHVNGAASMGPVWDELEALGAIWQVRGRHGELFTGRPSWHGVPENIASDITRMFPDWLGEHCYCGPGSLGMGSKAHDFDPEFMECLKIARADIPNEYKPSEHDWTQEQLESYLALALRRMRNGFRKAQKRYGDGFHGANQFVAIREAVEASIRTVDYEGQTFRLSYGNGEASITEIYDY